MPPFDASERVHQTHYKLTSPDVSAEAHADGHYGKKGPYPFCLPADHALENLLPAIRETAPRHFRNHAIQWHGPNGDLPNNHLLSSQVSCVNFLFPFIDKPEALAELLRPHFPAIERVLPVPGEGGCVTFEWTGDHDYLGESRRGGARTRGANCTSADAFAMFEDKDGVRRVLLIEWKYTEKYGGACKANGPSGRKRLATYAPFYHADDCPLDRTRVPCTESLFYEPFYQLMRLQFLANEVEKDFNRLGEGRYVVSVVHICPKANTAFQRVTSPPLRSLGDSVTGIWSRLVRHADRFRSLSTEALFGGLDPESLPPRTRDGLQDWRNYHVARYRWL